MQPQEKPYLLPSSNQMENVFYNFSDCPASIQRDYLSHYPNYAALSHWHDDVEFILILSGEMDYCVNGAVVTLKEGEGIFVNTRQMHYGFSAKCKECDFLCFLLHPSMLVSSASIESAYIEPVLQNSAFPFRHLHPTVDWEKQVLTLLRNLYFELDSEVSGLYISSLFYAIWLQLFKNAPKDHTLSLSTVRHMATLKQMMHFVQENYRKKLTLSDIAASATVCKSTANSLFRQYLNQTPVTYLTRYRLQQSIELMRTTELNITEIGFEAGFSGTSYYVETFHRYYGVSPLEYKTKFIIHKENRK